MYEDNNERPFFERNQVQLEDGERNNQQQAAADQATAQTSSQQAPAQSSSQNTPEHSQ